MAAYAPATAPTAPAAPAALAKTDFVASHAQGPYAIAVDPSGKLYWQTNAIDGDHVVAVLTEQVSPAYLTFLQGHHVSYLFAGSQTLDLPTALAKLAERLQIKTLLLEGGGKLNGTTLRAGLINEITVCCWCRLPTGRTGPLPCLMPGSRRRGRIPQSG